MWGGQMDVQTWIKSNAPDTQQWGHKNIYLTT